MTAGRGFPAIPGVVFARWNPVAAVLIAPTTVRINALLIATSPLVRCDSWHVIWSP